MSRTISQWAEYYTKNMGLNLVPIEPNRKFPRSKDWGKLTLNNPMLASAFYESKSDWNMGVALGPSKVCSLDIDCMESFKTICAAFGVDLPSLTAEYPTIQGSLSGMRIMFSVPVGVELPYVKLNWRPESDPTGSKHKEIMAQARAAKENGETGLEAELREQAKEYAMYTVFELRSACDGSQKQDVLPPSWHADAGKHYEWITEPNGKLPEPPEWLLTIWTQFKDKFEVQFKMACPWANADEVYEKKTTSTLPRYTGDSGGFSNVVNEFNRVSDIEQTLSHYGYRQVSGKRWLSPCSSTGLAGVAVFDSNKCWIHHASDPLCSDESGRPVAPFDLVCYHDHGGDFKAAITAIGQAMGISTSAPRSNSTASQQSAQTEHPFNAPANSEYLSSQPVDIYSVLPYTDEKGKPLKHHENLKEIINRIGAEVRYNEIKKEEEIVIPGETFSTDNAANASFAYITSMCSLFNYPTDKNQEFMTYIADKNIYNPAKEWIFSKPWDGKCRLKALSSTITTAGCNELKKALIKRWLLSAVAAAVMPRGVAAGGILVLQGAQDLGKTMWFKNLVPKSINNKYHLLQDSMLLDVADKDSIKQVCSFWMVELGELDSTFKKSDVSRLKAFVTRDTDIFRKPYAKKESVFARRTVFFGSVNPREFLHDDTGNRRYWTIEATHIDHSHDIDMQQLWAQMYDMLKSGESYMLTREEAAMLNTSNEDFQTSDPIEERIMDYYDWEAPRSQWEYLQTTMILLQVGVDRPSKGDVMKASKVIRELNGGETKRENNKRLSLMPPRVFKS